MFNGRVANDTTRPTSRGAQACIRYSCVAARRTRGSHLRKFEKCVKTGCLVCCYGSHDGGRVVALGKRAELFSNERDREVEARSADAVA